MMCESLARAEADRVADLSSPATSDASATKTEQDEGMFECMYAEKLDR
jgi:hypothetical protein